MRNTINHLANKLGDLTAGLFAIAFLLLIPHAIIRLIVGYGFHCWIPIQWLAGHAILIRSAAGKLLGGKIMADEETIRISLETQNKVAKAIYLRWYRNGRRHPRPWNEMAMEDKEPWRRIAKDAIRTFLASTEVETMLDDVYDKGYDAAKAETEGTDTEGGGAR